MAEFTLFVDGQPAWEFDHHLPVFWPWLFEPSSITESRRLHNTLLDAGDRFRQLRSRIAKSSRYEPVAALFHELSPDGFAKALGQPPDSVLMLEVGRIEERRPFSFAKSCGEWEAFFKACEGGQENEADRHWEEAALSPLRFRGNNQLDAVAIVAHAEALGLERDERGRALIWLLFGRPVSRAAKALNHTWIERAEELDFIRFRPRIRWWQRILATLKP